MKRILFAVALCAITAISGAWTLQWDADSSWPDGTTISACLNGVCVSGITGNNQSFNEIYPPGTVLHGTAQVVPPVWYQCGGPLGPCPPFGIAEIAQTIPSDQLAPSRSAWAGTGITMAAAIGSTSTVTNAQRTNTTITAPSGIANNDVLVALLLVGAASAPTVTPPSGFSEVTTTGWPIPVNAADPWQLRLRLYWKVASSESGNYTFSHASAYTEAIMYRITGADTTTPISPNPTSATGTGTTATATGLTTPRDGSVVIYAAGAWDAAGPTTPPTGTAPTFAEYYDGGSSGVFYSAAGVMATAGATGNKSNTNANSSGTPWLAGLICVQSAASGGTTYSYSATGGIALGGSSPIKRTFSRPASGGITTGGAAALKRTQTIAATGGITTGGAAALKRTQAIAATGGVTTGGAASASKSSGNSYIASGGVTTGGAAALKRTQVTASTGGVTTGGAAALKRTQATASTGGVTTGGAAALKRTQVIASTGGITIGGAAALKRTQATASTGGVTTGGAAALKRTQVTASTGGIVTGGAATASKSSPGQNSYTASGGVTTGGAATLKRTQTVVGAGGIATGGAATLKRSFAQRASGGLSTSGVAVLKQIRAYLASGGVATSGSASVTLTAGAFSYVASGGVSLGGSASVPTWLRYAASGGLTVGGSSLAGYYPISRILPSGRLVVLSKSDRHIVLQRSGRLISLLPSDRLIIPA